MEKTVRTVKRGKAAILALFVLLSVVSVMLIGTIKINYNISDYLDEATDTKISLGIMEKEFGLISNVQVMVRDVSKEDAEIIKNKIKLIENVIFVNFNAENPDYYKDGCALFVVLVNGNEYSESAKAALLEIETTLGELYENKVELGGTVMEKRLLRAAIQSEIMLILAISVGLVAILMLITSASWIEPLVLLASSGVAVLLNMGSNAIFGQISYITNAIAAILQLALSIDYSIVLLHAYRHHKNTEEHKEIAMLKAIKEVVRPVSASALTTIAGLLALLFMSFTIGFDIGSVLMKSIVISAITSLTLLPVLLLIFDKPMEKTAKKPIVIGGKAITNFALKAGKVIVPAALVLVAISCVLNFNSKYSFVDSCNKNEEITDTFGDSGTLIVLYKNCEDSAEKEKLLLSLVESYRKENGEGVLKSAVSYSSTVGQVFDVKKAESELGLSPEDANLLFTVYRFTADEEAVRMDTRTFIDFAIDLIENDPDADGFAAPETAEMLRTLLAFDEMLDRDYTAEELYDAIINLEMLEGITLEYDTIEQLYGNKFYSSVTDKTVRFDLMLDYLIASGLLDSSLTADLQMLSDAYDNVQALDMELPHPDMQVGLLELREINQDLGFGADDRTITGLATKLGVAGSKRIAFTEVFDYLVANYIDLFGDELLAALDKIGSYDYRYIYETKELVEKTFSTRYSFDEFMPALLSLADKLGRNPGVVVDREMKEQLEQLYIMYFLDEGKIALDSLNILDFLQYILDLSAENSVIASRIPEGGREKLEALIADANRLSKFLSDSKKRHYLSMHESVLSFARDVESLDVDISLTDTAIMGLYVKYAAKNELLDLGEISATDLLAFVLDAAENNPLLSGRITDDMKEMMTESTENIAGAEALLRAKNYSRVLLTVTLPPESEDSRDFVVFLSEKVKEIFGNEAYVAGEIATTNDLTVAFDADSRLINIFTVVSIFIIIMVVFKSLSLPVILVAIIQGAVWISMSLSALGDPMFFMSYIMSMCILMGATIDYGILLSTNYVCERRTKDKGEALISAMNGALPTIFTSGLILMVCGAVVGFVASQTSISSVGFLLFRGTLVSCIMITLVLPALLYALDKLVLGLTVKSKK